MLSSGASGFRFRIPTISTPPDILQSTTHISINTMLVVMMMMIIKIFYDDNNDDDDDTVYVDDDDNMM